MSRSSTFSTPLLLVTVALAGSALATDVVLKDGTVIEASRPYQTKGTTALITLKDGTLVSVPLSRVDVQRTAELAAKPKAAAPAPTPVVAAPLTPAEAARQKRRKATVTLTDDQVAHPVGEGDEEGGAGSEEAGRVEVVSNNVSPGSDGFSVTGEVMNAGSSEAINVSVAVEAIGEDNKTLTTVFASVAKSRLAAGERSAFSATVVAEGARNFRYIPRWQVKMAVPDEGATEQAPGTAVDAPARPTPAPAAAAPAAPAPAPAAPPQPTVVPRGDVAAPPANAPMGNPTGSNSGYIPQSGSAQPKPPGQ